MRLGLVGHRDKDRDKDGDRDSHCFFERDDDPDAEGDKKIEGLAAGDSLPTVFGGTRPVRWIGHYRYRKSDPAKPWVRNVLSIRIARSALGPNVPHTDLYISDAHALLIDGLVVAGNLVNGTTITRYDSRELDQSEFFHIKLGRHDVIYPEGAPTETLLEVDESANIFVIRTCDDRRDAVCTVASVRLPERRNKVVFRSAIAPWIDCRQRVDIIRDKLEARGIALLRQSEFVS